MRLRVVTGKEASSAGNNAAADAKNNADGAGALTIPGPADRNGAENGSKDESFFEARAWLDSDSEDDFYSVRGDFTPSRGSTPDHQKLTSFSGRMPIDRSKPSVTEKKQRLLELLQEKQQFDDEDDSVTDVGSDLENSAVLAEENQKISRKGKKLKKSSKSGCFPSLIGKHSFRMCREKRREKKDK